MSPSNREGFWKPCPKLSSIGLTGGGVRSMAMLSSTGLDDMVTGPLLKGTPLCGKRTLTDEIVETSGLVAGDASVVTVIGAKVGLWC